MLKEAPVSWRAIAFPQLRRLYITVNKGMALGIYSPEPRPMKSEATAI